MKKIEFGKAFAAGFNGISRLIIEFSTEQKNFTKNLRFSLAHTARKIHPKKTVTDLAHMTGLLRSQVDEALDGDFPIPVMDVESLILNDLWKIRDKNNLVPINDNSDNCTKAIALKQLKGKYSASTVIDSLIDSGSVKKEGESLVILSNSFSTNKGEMRVLNLMGLVINRFIGTIIYNRNASDQDDRLYQRSYKSTRVPPNSHSQMHKELHPTLQNLCMIELRKIIEKYEINVPEDTYPECGVSMFEFNKNK